jgi:hypothetical protein
MNSKVILGVAVIGIVLAGAIVFIVSQNKEDSNSTKNEDTQNTETGNRNSEDKKGDADIYKINQSIDLGDAVLKINDVIDPYTSEDANVEKEGYRLIALEVNLENKSTSEDFGYNFLDWKIKYNSYNGQYPIGRGSKEPSIYDSNLAPGESAIFWVTFQLESDVTDLVLEYKVASTKEKIIVQL